MRVYNSTIRILILKIDKLLMSSAPVMNRFEPVLGMGATQSLKILKSFNEKRLILFGFQVQAFCIVRKCIRLIQVQ